MTTKTHSLSAHARRRVPRMAALEVRVSRLERTVDEMRAIVDELTARQRPALRLVDD